jgi:hypothetical protein
MLPPSSAVWDPGAAILRRVSKMKKFVIVILNPIRNNSTTEAARPA